METTISISLEGIATLTWVRAISAGVLVLAGWGVLVLAFSASRSRRQRMMRSRIGVEGDALPPGRTIRLWVEGEEKSLEVPDLLPHRNVRRRMRDAWRDAGFRSDADRGLSLLVFGAGALGLVLGLLTGRAVSGVFGSAFVVLGFLLYLQRRIDRRRALFEQQLIDGLELSARALRAGHPLLGAFRLIATEIPAPIGKIFADVCQQQELGVDLETSLRKMARESESADLRLFSASLAINMQIGGNLADVMQGLAAVIRQRIRLGRRFRTLIAQTQFSKRVLLVLPVLMYGLLSMINPEYMDIFYYTGQGNLLLLAAGGGMALGWWTMNRMARLEA